MELVNDNLVLISGKSATGKSACLMGIKNPEGVMYLNCENNKKLPFKSKFKEYKITDPYQIYDAFTHAETDDSVHTIVIDTITYMMGMFESVHVVGATNTMAQWGAYGQFWRTLMSQYVANSSKNVICLAHTMDVMNEAEMVNETLVKVKGSIMNEGIESAFSTVISTKKVTVKKLKDYESDMLTITPEDEALGLKYVFQTKLTKDTVNERIRGSLGMWDTKETYIDNNVQHVLGRLHTYYK